MASWRAPNNTCSHGKAILIFRWRMPKRKNLKRHASRSPIMSTTRSAFWSQKTFFTRQWQAQTLVTRHSCHVHSSNEKANHINLNWRNVKWCFSSSGSWLLLLFFFRFRPIKSFVAVYATFKRMNRDIAYKLMTAWTKIGIRFRLLNGVFSECAVLNSSSSNCSLNQIHMLKTLLLLYHMVSAWFFYEKSTSTLHMQTR